MLSLSPGVRIMVLALSSLSTRLSCRIARDLLVKTPSFFGHPVSSFAAVRCGDQFGKSKFRSLLGAVRMSSTPAEQPSGSAKDGDAENVTKTVQVIIKGRVQGVYYRNWTVDTAQQLGVNGWVRNLKDGSVEAVFSGKSAVVDSLIQKCYQGPSAARVSNVEVSAWTEEVPQGFERKPTVW